MLKVTLEEARTALGLPVVDDDGTTIDFPARALTLHEGEVFDCVDDALVCAFDWSASPEGAEFWTEVWSNALACIKEPTSPGKARPWSLLAEVLDEDAWPGEDLDLYSAATGHRAVQERLTTKPKEV